jgi:hypothetical protein
MRSYEEVQRVKGLIGEGLNNCAIARETGISVTTVRKWRAGEWPRRALVAKGPTCDSCGWRCLPLAAGQEEAYSYLFGQYLGDGTILKHRRKVFRLAIYGDARHRQITTELVEAFQTVMPANKVMKIRHGSDNCVAVSAYSRSWPCLFPQAGPGRKDERTIALTDWQQAITTRFPEAFVRGLIHSDGCRSTNPIRGRGKIYRYPRYSFCNKSDDIKAIFCEHLDLLGIPWRRMNAMNISIARREGVARLDEFVGPKG